MNAPKTCMAAILVELNKPLEIEEIQLPDKLDVGQVLVQVFYSGICGSQLGEISGVKGEDNYLPHLLGHEGSGQVVAVGPGVRTTKPGDTVVLHWRKSLGIEAVPPKYLWGDKTLNAGLVTTFNEYAVVSENRVTVIPESSDLQIATLFGCAITTGFGVVENNAKLKIGESVVVFGAGGVGLNIVQSSALGSAYPIIAVDVFDNRLELAKKMGATHIINSRRENAEARIREIMAGADLDVFIDNTGNPGIIETGYLLTGPQGRVILVGVPRKGNNISLFSLPMHFGKTLTGSHGGEAVPHEDIPRFQRMLDNKQLHFDEVISDTFELSQINTAIEAMKSGQTAGRCLIKMK